MNTQLDERKSVSTGHSSDVRMFLHIQGRSIAVFQSSESAVKVNAIDVVPQGDGIVEITVDGRMHRREIRVLGPTGKSGWLAIEGR